jgi:cell wall-associated NlpC family hydrolase
MNEADVELIDRATDLKAQTEEQHAIFEKEAAIAAQKAEEAAAAKAEAEETAAAYQAEYDGLSAQLAEALEAAREAERLQQEAEAQRVVQESAEAAAREAEEREAAEEAARRAQEAAQADEGEEASVSLSAFDEVETSGSYEGGSTTVDRAYSCMGLPYVWGATGPGSYDCSGLVGYALTGSHDRIGTTYTFMGWPKATNPQPGDVCTSWGHCGIYIGDGQMIHAPHSGDVVKVGPVQSDMIIVRYPG